MSSGGSGGGGHGVFPGQAVLGFVLIPASGSAEAGKIRSSWGMELLFSSSSGAGSSLLSPVVKGMVATARNRKNSI